MCEGTRQNEGRNGPYKVRDQVQSIESPKYKNIKLRKKGERAERESLAIYTPFKLSEDLAGPARGSPGLWPST
jgi:hypothetical protein